VERQKEPSSSGQRQEVHNRSKARKSCCSGNSRPNSMPVRAEPVPSIPPAPTGESLNPNPRAPTASNPGWHVVLSALYVHTRRRISTSTENLPGGVCWIAAAADPEEQARQLEYYRALDDGTCYQVGHTSSCTCPICTQNRRRAHEGAKGMKPGGSGGGGGGGGGGGMYRPNPNPNSSLSEP